MIGLFTFAGICTVVAWFFKITAQRNGPKIIRISEEDLQSYIDRCKTQARTTRKEGASA